MKLGNFDQIERYLRDEMPGYEREAFEAELEGNADLRREVAMQQDIQAGTNYHFSLDLKKKLQSHEALATPKHEQQPRKRFRSLWPAVGIAASLTLAALATYLLVFDKSSPDQLYQAYYQPYPNIIDPVERSSSIPQDEAGQALLAYEKGDFQEAIRLFEAEPGLNSGQQFYLALSYLETGKQQQAIELLKQVAATKQDSFFLPSLWYQGLAYLSVQDTQQAEKVLKKLLEEDSAYESKAREILSEL